MSATTVFIAALLLVTGLGFALALAAGKVAAALREVAGELRTLHAATTATRETLHEGLGQLTDATRHQTAAVRETAAQAPEAVVAQRDRLAADNEKLTGVLEQIVTFRPDPQKGTYGAGAQDVLDYAREATRTVLS